MKVFLLFPMSVAASCLFASNLLPNGTFEGDRPSSGWWVPDNWSIDAHGGRNGGAALVWSDGAGAKHPLSRVKLEPGVSYRLSVWIRSDRLTRGTGCVSLEWRDAKDGYLGGIRVREVINNDVRAIDGWRQYEARSATIPVQAVSASVNCSVSGDAKGRVAFDDFTLEPVARKWMEYLASSAYRDLAWEGTVRFATPLFVNTVRFPLDTVGVELSFVNANGMADRVPPKTFTPSEAVFEVPVSRLKIGRQTISARIFSAVDGKTFATCTLPFERTRDAPNRKVWIDAKGRTILDGKPFFPLGMYTSHEHMSDDDFKRWGNSPFNFAMEYSHMMKPAQLDRYAARGIHVALDIRGLAYTRGCGSKEGPKDLETEHRLVREFVKNSAGHPAVLGWYMVDEAPVEWFPAISELNAFLRETDPDHPTWAVHDTTRVVRSMLPCFDVLGMDPYPIGNGGRGERGAISLASRWPLEARREMFDFRPMWQVPQAYNWAWHPSRATRTGAHFPTREEMANMNWQAVAAGANGLCSYAYYPLKQHYQGAEFERIWQQICETSAEVKRMISVILSNGDAPRPEGVPEDLLVVRTFSYENRVWVLAVNRTVNPVKAVLRFPFSVSTVWPYLGPRTSAVARNGEVAIDLPGLGYAFAACSDKGDDVRRNRGFQLDRMPQVCREERPVADEEPSLLPSGRKFKLVWHDEFNGSALDESKWSYRTNFWGETAHWYARPEDGCVEVRDGKARLMLKKRADGQVVSPQLQTGEIVWDLPRYRDPDRYWPFRKRQLPKFLHRYGYYECRCRLQRMPGWWSAFWMQTPSQGVSLDPAFDGVEHDIMESFEPGKLLPACFHYNGYGADYRGFRIPDDHPRTATVDIDTDSFHRFGLLWTPDGYSIYVDGRLRGSSSQAVSHRPQFLLVSTEAMNFRDRHMTGAAHPDLEKAVARGDDFVVDYVRVFDIVE